MSSNGSAEKQVSRVRSCDIFTVYVMVPQQNNITYPSSLALCTVLNT